MKAQRANSTKERFENLYQTESDAVFRYCLYRVSDYNQALDLTQTVFMRYWDALSQGREILNDRAFIFMIARNLIIDFYRKKKSLSLDSILEENEDQMFMADDVNELDAEISSEARFILGKISELEPIHQQVIYLRYVEDMRPHEIAEVLEVSSNVVSVRIVRGLEKLRELSGINIKEKNGRK